MTENEMGAHAALNDIRYPRSDWGLGCGALIAIILSVVSLAVILATPEGIFATKLGFFLLFSGSLLIGIGSGMAIQRLLSAQVEKQETQFRQEFEREKERQLKEFIEANKK